MLIQLSTLIDNINIVLNYLELFIWKCFVMDPEMYTLYLHKDRSSVVNRPHNRAALHNH